ncbi:hypothetical protein EZV62_014138 [Acer yangbiense]|uniref:F-box domain-containing protein n=1 Tax=Acer yangbiense TaxID=1000413 RepID=A0A5C7HRX0_9ROSI|nr:hypothetical protein EZV62_014138 [Acer yangbiense]
MERPCKKVKISDEIQRSDRLSNLPDPIIHHILSLMNTKCAVRTCVLSKNRSYHWTNIHTLSFCRHSFTNTLVFCDFISNVLHRINHLKLLKLKLDCWNTTTRHKITSLVFEYAISHGFEELDTDMVDTTFPQILFQYQTLKTLKTTRGGNRSLEKLQTAHANLEQKVDGVSQDIRRILEVLGSTNENLRDCEARARARPDREA